MLLCLFGITNLVSCAVESQAVSEGSCNAEELGRLQGQCLGYGGSFSAGTSAEDHIECEGSAGESLTGVDGSAACTISGKGDCAITCTLPENNNDDSQSDGGSDSDGGSGTGGGGSGSGGSSGSDGGSGSGGDDGGGDDGGGDGGDDDGGGDGGDDSDSDSDSDPSEEYEECISYAWDYFEEGDLDGDGDRDDDYDDYAHSVVMDLGTVSRNVSIHGRWASNWETSAYSCEGEVDLYRIYFDCEGDPRIDWHYSSGPADMTITTESWTLTDPTEDVPTFHGEMEIRAECISGSWGGGDYTIHIDF
jgi:hypothetical protein